MKGSRNELGKTVHIIPLGHERERATFPFEDRKADLIYLVVDERGLTATRSDDMSADQVRFTDLVYNDLTKKGLTVKIVYTNTFNLATLINTLSKLIILEQENKSTIFMNMSSSGRFASVAASIAGMAHDVRLYYVHSNNFAESRKERLEHGVSICESVESRVEEFANYRFEVPDKIELTILEELFKKKEKGYHWATTKELADVLCIIDDSFDMPLFREMPKEEKEKMSEGDKTALRNTQSRVLMRLNNSLMKRLIAKKYVERNDPKESKVRYKITASGEYALHLSGFGDKLEIRDYVAPNWIIEENEEKRSEAL